MDLRQNAPDFKLVRSARRTLQISVDLSGEVTVRAPNSCSVERIHVFVAERSDWLARARARMQKRKVAAKTFENGSVFYVEGAEWRLTVIPDHTTFVKFEEQPQGWCAICPQAMSADVRALELKRILTLWYRRLASDRLPAKVELWAGRMGLAQPKVVVKTQKRLWGSCHCRTRIINLNWQIVTFPANVMDYIIVHELCHLRQANHSRRFWKEVEAVLPEYKQARSWLKLHAQRYCV